MAGKMSEFTEAILSVLGDVVQAKDKAKEADPVPLMQERKVGTDAKQSYQDMSEFQRQMFLDTNGQEKLLNIARGGGTFDVL